MLIPTLKVWPPASSSFLSFTDLTFTPDDNGVTALQKIATLKSGGRTLEMAMKGVVFSRLNRQHEAVEYVGTRVIEAALDNMFSALARRSSMEESASSRSAEAELDDILAESFPHQGASSNDAGEGGDEESVESSSRRRAEGAEP